MSGSVSREEIDKMAKALVDLTIAARDGFQKVQAMINTTRKIEGHRDIQVQCDVNILWTQLRNQNQIFLSDSF